MTSFMKRFEGIGQPAQSAAVVVIILLISLGLGSCQPGGEGLQVGDKAPDFKLASSDGDTVALADYRGQPVLLYFHMALG